MAQKNVELVMAPGEVHWVGDGFRVHNFIPSRFHLERERMDPFILLDYNSKYKFEPSSAPMGVGVHPHRGFETVTIAYQGKVEHHDSYGGGGVIGEGDAQWMTAASGVLHKEYHEKKWSERGGMFQMVQLWVNLPAKYKMGRPRYQAIPNSGMVKVVLPENKGLVEVIAGEYEGMRGPANTFSPVNLMNARLHKGGNATFSFPGNYNTALLVLEGNIVVNNTEEVPIDHFLLFKNEGETFEIEASDEAVVLVMSGEPLHEPIVAHGPFVMNMRREIVQAFDDFNQGKFGYLKE